MTDQVEVPFGDKPGETATLLLAAAEDLELDAGVIRTTSEGTFVVPQEVADKAKVDVKEDEDSGPKSIDDMTKSELEAEVARRNTGREDDAKIEPDGKNKPDLLAALKADDKAKE